MSGLYIKNQDISRRCVVEVEYRTRPSSAFARRFGLFGSVVGLGVQSLLQAHFAQRVGLVQVRRALARHHERLR
jgi:hypothetical protein